MRRTLFSIAMIAVMLVALPGSLQASAAPLQAAGTATVRQIHSGVMTAFPSAGARGADLSGPNVLEIAPGSGSDAAKLASKLQTKPRPRVNRSQSLDNQLSQKSLQSQSLQAPHVPSTSVDGAKPALTQSFDGLNHRDQRLANGGNQFSLEPPDQGLCAGNGFVMETINDVLRVYDSAGHPKTDVIDLNTFYGYPAAFVRPTGPFGPSITDPSCYYDSDTHRWFHVVLTLDQDPTTGDLLGTNHLDLAVSTSSDPTGGWIIYSVPVQDDGTDGTPNHGCSQGPCIGDYPHMGADKYGLYLTTNEYSFFGPEYHSSQIYAFSKKALAANNTTVTMVQLDTTGAVHSSAGVQPGFTVWPAISPAAVFNTQANGTEFFLSSNAGEEANGVPGGGFSNEVVLWALSNTSSLDSSSPNPALSNHVLHSEVYGVPPASDQKKGSVPLAECVNYTTMLTPFGTGCWNFFFVTEPAHDEVESHIDSNDSRMQQVSYVNGRVWGALDTVVHVGGQDRAGIAYFVVRPSFKEDGIDAHMVKQGYLAVAGNNVNYPAIAVLPSGRGIMAFTLVGKDYYPSAAYARVGLRHGTGVVHVAARGRGPSDGFTGYKAFVGDPPRPRWGDYGAAVTDGRRIWISSEYIAQTCTLAQYVSDPFGSCGGTRTSLANWATRVSSLRP